jgi:2,3-dihydroxybenzoate-AMP ligase
VTSARTPRPPLDGGLVRFPADVVARYLAVGAWRDLTVAEEFHAIATARPDHIALICQGVELTFAELDVHTDRFAAGALRLGLRPGYPVLLQVHNTPHAVIAWYGLLKAGLIPVCTLAPHRRHEISEISRHTRAVAHLVDATRPRAGRGFDLVGFALDHADGHDTIRHVLTIGAGDHPGTTPVEDLGAGIAADEARRAVEVVQAGLGVEDVVAFQLSGGTTGIPKVIPRLQAEYWYNARLYAEWLGWDGAERVAYVGPLVHNAGIICGLHGPHAAGATAVLGTPDVAGVVPLLVAHRATDIVLGPFAYDVAVDPGLADATALRRLVFSGKRVPAAAFDAVQTLGIWAGQLFGMGEGLCMTTRLDAPRAVRATTVGTRLSPLDEVRILDPGTEDATPDGQVGELCARGPYTLRGYYDAADHNRTAFTSDGFYRTGDLLAYRVVDGVRCYTIEGRIKDLINRGGEKINAEEVENLLVAHPDITDAALVAMPDPTLGERVCAFLVGSDQLSMEEIRAHLEGLGVARYKWPERFEWLPELPRASQVGKTDKKRLRAMAADLVPNEGRGAGEPSPRPPDTAVGSLQRMSPRPSSGSRNGNRSGRKTTARRELVETEIHERAAGLFAQRGFAGTSLQDIADSVGITRQALYYYVRSKEEILGRLVSDLTERIVARMHEIRDDPTLGPVQKLRSIAHLLASDRAVNRVRFQLLDRSAAALPADLAAAYLEGRRNALAEVRAVIDAGIEAGAFRWVDSRIAALSVLGMCNWVAWWFEPGPDHPVEPIAAQIAEGAVAMLRATEGTPSADPRAALAAARAGLDHLERLLQPRTPQEERSGPAT